MSEQINPTKKTNSAGMALLDVIQQRGLKIDPSTIHSVFLGLRDGATLSHAMASSAGWWTDLETGEDVRTCPPKFLALWVSAKLLLIVTEIAEATEGHRKDLMDDKLPHRKMLEVEMADALLRILDLAGGLGFDLGGAVIEKLAFNAGRADHKPENRALAGGKSI